MPLVFTQVIWHDSENSSNMKDLKHIETPWDNKPSFLATSAQAQPKIIHCRRKHFKDSSTRTTCFCWYGCVAVGGHLASPWYSHFSSLLVSQTHLPQHFSRHTKEKHVYIKPRHFWAFLGNKRSNEIPGFSIAILKHSKTMTCDESGSLYIHTIEWFDYCLLKDQKLLLNTDRHLISDRGNVEFGACFPAGFPHYCSNWILFGYKEGLRPSFGWQQPNRTHTHCSSVFFFAH